MKKKGIITPMTPIRVTTGKEKLSALYSLCKQAIASQKRLIISVPSEEASKFIDQFLWSAEPDAFIPHEMALGPTDELIAITVGSKNYNKAEWLFNLNQDRSKIEGPFEEVYELIDASHPEKEKLFSLKLSQ